MISQNPYFFWGGAGLGIFKPKAQDIETRIFSKMLHRFQTMTYSDVFFHGELRLGSLVPDLSTHGDRQLHSRQCLFVGCSTVVFLQQ